MTTNLAPQIQCKDENEQRNVSVSFMGKLEVGELLTGAPTVIEVGTSDLTIGNEQVSTVELNLNGKKVPAGGAVQFSVSGGVEGTTYFIDVQCATDASPSQTLITRITLEIV